MEKKPPETVEFRPLTPERRRGTTTLAQAGCGCGCCCCCCCCCLHSVGGVVGALLVSGSETEEESRSVAAFWYSFLALTLVIAVIMGTTTDWGSGGILLVLALVLPAIQLGACLLAFLLGPLTGELDYSKVGKIMGYTIVGSVIGLLVMVIPLAAFS